MDFQHLNKKRFCFFHCKVACISIIYFMSSIQDVVILFIIKIYITIRRVSFGRTLSSDNLNDDKFVEEYTYILLTADPNEPEWNSELVSLFWASISDAHIHNDIRLFIVFCFESPSLCCCLNS